MTKSREELVEDLALELESLVCHGYHAQTTDPAMLFRKCKNDCEMLRVKIRNWMNRIKPAEVGTTPEKGPSE